MTQKQTVHEEFILRDIRSGLEFNLVLIGKAYEALCTWRLKLEERHKAFLVQYYLCGSHFPVCVLPRVGIVQNELLLLPGMRIKDFL